MEKEGQGSSSPGHGSTGNISPAENLPSSRTNVSPGNDPHTEIPQQSSQHNSPVESRNPKEPIDDFNWDELEKRFHGKMIECRYAEEEIYEEFHNLLEVSLSSFCQVL